MDGKVRLSPNWFLERIMLLKVALIGRSSHWRMYLDTRLSRFIMIIIKIIIKWGGGGCAEIRSLLTDFTLRTELLKQNIKSTFITASPPHDAIRSEPS